MPLNDNALRPQGIVEGQIFFWYCTELHLNFIIRFSYVKKRLSSLDITVLNFRFICICIVIQNLKCIIKFYFLKECSRLTIVEQTMKTGMDVLKHVFHRYNVAIFDILLQFWIMRLIAGQGAKKSYMQPHKMC